MNNSPISHTVARVLGRRDMIIIDVGQGARGKERGKMKMQLADDAFRTITALVWDACESEPINVINGKVENAMDIYRAHRDGEAE